MIISKFGQQINATENPIEAVKLALQASAGCGSKANAWAWARDAVSAAKFHSEKFANHLSDALDNTDNNFPNVKAAELVVEGQNVSSSPIFYVSEHISGGYLLGIPSRQFGKAHNVAANLSVWQNQPMLEKHVEYEFPKYNWQNIESFSNWVQVTFGLCTNAEVEINKI